MKQFLIIGTLNAVTYKEIIPSIKRGEVWFGEGKNLDFILPDGIIKGATSRWFTNLGKNNRKPLQLTEHYSPEKYPRFDNYEAINVNRVKDIPDDYYGVIGVPATYLDKHCPEQFEIIRFRKGNDDKDLSVSGKCPYFRILIRRK